MKKVQKATAKGKAAKAEKITVELTVANSRKLRELMQLVESDAAAFVNLMVQEELDQYLDAGSGNLLDLVNGWKYDSPAQARRVADKLNNWRWNYRAANPPEDPEALTWNTQENQRYRITTKGRELVNGSAREELQEELKRRRSKVA